MIDNLKPYSEYKDSGLPWVGMVPSHWCSERAKWLFEKMDRPVREQDEVVTCFRDGTVTLRKNRRLTGFTEATAFFGYQGIRKGDLVIHGMDAFAGAIGVSDSDGKSTPVYIVCKPNVGIDANYYAQLVRHMSRSGWILALAKGIRERSTDFRFKTFGDQLLLLPPPAEQSAIVRFLASTSGRIERAIRSKLKVIALLNEQKQVIIHRAVARGLDPSVPLKDSGIPWLGDIPAHWVVHRTKTIAHIKTGGRDTAHRVDEGIYPFFVRSQTVERINSFSFDGEAVLTAGDGAGVAKVFHHINGRFDYHQRVYKFSNFKHVSGRYFFRWLQSTLKFEALDASAKSTVDSLRLPLLQNFPTVVPPADEQAAIVEFVEREAQSIESVESRLEREIILLREYRTRLIADVVTGKLDVRAVAAALPDEAALDYATVSPDTDDVRDSKDLTSGEASE